MIEHRTNSEFFHSIIFISYIYSYEYLTLSHALLGLAHHHPLCSRVNKTRYLYKTLRESAKRCFIHDAGRIYQSHSLTLNRFSCMGLASYVWCIRLCCNDSWMNSPHKMNSSYRFSRNISPMEYSNVEKPIFHDDTPLHWNIPRNMPHYTMIPHSIIRNFSIVLILRITLK